MQKRWFANVLVCRGFDPHMDLFARQIFAQQPHPNLAGVNIGNDHFFNHTRTQLRNQ